MSRMMYTIDIYHAGDQAMPDIAKIFMNGRSQAVRLPAAFRFKGHEVLIERRGDAVILREKSATLGTAMREFFANADPLPEDFLKDRGDAPPQARELF
jgi:antitoxin VapB